MAIVSLLSATAPCSLLPHGGTWPWDGLQMLVVQLACAVHGLPGDAQAGSRNVACIKPGGVRAVRISTLGSLKQGHLREFSQGGSSSQNPYPLGFIAAANSRSCSPSSDSSLKFVWFESAWGGWKPTIGGWQGSIHGDLR
jgi:hypothetical protein